MIFFLLVLGDHFGMKDGLVYCRSHYQELPMISPDYDDHYTSPSPDFNHHHHHSHHHHHHSIHSSETPSPSNPDSVKVNAFFNGAPTPRQKGRPRKRKPKDIEGLTANLGEYLIIIFSCPWTYFFSRSQTYYSYFLIQGKGSSRRWKDGKRWNQSLNAQNYVPFCVLGEYLKW